MCHGNDLCGVVQLWLWYQFTAAVDDKQMRVDWEAQSIEVNPWPRATPAQVPGPSPGQNIVHGDPDTDPGPLQET